MTTRRIAFDHLFTRLESAIISLNATPSQLDADAALSALSLVGDLAASSAGDAGIATGTDSAIGGTISSLLSSSLLSANMSNATNATTAARRRRRWRARQLDEATTDDESDDGAAAPTAPPTTAAALADGAVLTAVVDAIGNLAAAQISSAVTGEAASTLDTANVMMASARATAASAAAGGPTPPANAGGGAPAVSLGSAALSYENGSAVAADAVVDTTVHQWGVSPYATSDTGGTATASPLVSLSFSTTDDDDDDDGGGDDDGRRRGRRRRRLYLTGGGRRLSDDDDNDAADAPVMLVLQNVAPIDYKAAAVETYVNLTCTDGASTQSLSFHWSFSRPGLFSFHQGALPPPPPSNALRSRDVARARTRRVHWSD